MNQMHTKYTGKTSFYEYWNKVQEADDFHLLFGDTRVQTHCREFMIIIIQGFITQRKKKVHQVVCLTVDAV